VHKIVHTLAQDECFEDHGIGRKVGGDGRVAIDNRQQWQRQPGNNQLKVMVTSGGIDYS
jgi:hypothetical protein